MLEIFNLKKFIKNLDEQYLTYIINTEEDCKIIENKSKECERKLKNIRYVLNLILTIGLTTEIGILSIGNYKYDIWIMVIVAIVFYLLFSFLETRFIEIEVRNNDLKENIRDYKLEQHFSKLRKIIEEKEEISNE